jgi:ABC-2 type transport system permease protein
MLRASWLAAASYRLSMMFAIFGLIIGVIPLFFIANALQGVMAKAIQYEGGHYFGFLLMGMVAYLFVTESLGALPNSISGTVSSGTLDTLLGTPTSPVALFAGLTSYGFTWAFVRALIMVLVGVVLGVRVEWSNALLALVAVLLVILAYGGLGLISAAMIVAFRTDGPLRAGILAVTALLGGVYYPTNVIPSWLKTISVFVPLTYGLRALRLALLDGRPLSAMAGDFAALIGFIVLFGAIGVFALRAAFRYARRAGTLTQY